MKPSVLSSSCCLVSSLMLLPSLVPPALDVTPPSSSPPPLLLLLPSSSPSSPPLPPQHMTSGPHPSLFLCFGATSSLFFPLPVQFNLLFLFCFSFPCPWLHETDFLFMSLLLWCAFLLLLCFLHILICETSF